MVDLSIVILVYQRVERGVRNLAACDSFFMAQRPSFGFFVHDLSPNGNPYAATVPYWWSSPDHMGKLSHVLPVTYAYIHIYNYISGISMFFLQYLSQSNAKERNQRIFHARNLWKENPSTSVHRIIPPPSAKSGNSLKNPACKEAGPPDKPAVPLNPRLSDGLAIVVPWLHGYTILSHLLKKTVEHGLTKYPISVLVIWPFVMALDITCAMLTTCSMFSVQGHPILIRWWHFFSFIFPKIPWEFHRISILNGSKW